MTQTLARGLVNTLFSGVSPGAGSTFAVPLSKGNGKYGDYCEDFFWQLATTGNPASVGAQLQGSLDGTNWFNIGSALNAAGSASIDGVPLAFIRANVTTLTSGTAAVTLVF